MAPNSWFAGDRSSEAFTTLRCFPVALLLSRETSLTILWKDCHRHWRFLIRASDNSVTHGLTSLITLRNSEEKMKRTVRSEVGMSLVTGGLFSANWHELHKRHWEHLFSRVDCCILSFEHEISENFIPVCYVLKPHMCQTSIYNCSNHTCSSMLQISMWYGRHFHFHEHQSACFSSLATTEWWGLIEWLWLLLQWWHHHPFYTMALDSRERNMVNWASLANGKSKHNSELTTNV